MTYNFPLARARCCCLVSHLKRRLKISLKEKKRCSWRVVLIWNSLSPRVSFLVREKMDNKRMDNTDINLYQWFRGNGTKCRNSIQNPARNFYQPQKCPNSRKYFLSIPGVRNFQGRNRPDSLAFSRFTARLVQKLIKSDPIHFPQKIPISFLTFI